jgi:hypothetical protein
LAQQPFLPAGPPLLHAQLGPHLQPEPHLPLLPLRPAGAQQDCFPPLLTALLLLLLLALLLSGSAAGASGMPS